MPDLVAVLKSPVTYVLTSYALVLFFVLDCVNTFRELYPVIIYLTNSTVFEILGVNAFLATAVALWKALQWTFFGDLTSGEAMAVATSASFQVSDCVVSLLYADQPLIGRYGAAFVLTAVWQVLHRVERERMTVLGSLPLTQRRRKVLGLVWFAVFSVIVNVTVVYAIVDVVTETGQRNALALYTLAIMFAQSLFITLHAVSLLGFGAWRSGDLSRKAFFIKVFWNYVSALHFIAVFIYVAAKAVAPFSLVRYLLLEVMTLSETTVSLQRYLRLSRTTSRLPAATEEDLQDAPRCSICYEDMVTGAGVKKLPCGHCYHAECLQQWFQSNSTCPYCRADLLKPARHAAGAAAAADGAPEAAAAAAAADGAQRPQSQPQPGGEQQQSEQQPRAPITGDAMVDAALEDALAADQGNLLSVVIAYERYRQERALHELQRRVAGAAERSPGAWAPAEARRNMHADPAPTVAPAPAAATSEDRPIGTTAAVGETAQPSPSESLTEGSVPRPAGEDSTNMLSALHQARISRLAFGPDPRIATSSRDTAHTAVATAAPVSVTSSTPVAAPAAAAAAVTNNAGRGDETAARLRAYERYRVAIAKAEEDLNLSLAALDNRGST